MRLLPFQFTTDPLTKLDPFTVRVKALPPAVTLLGESDAMAGTGLLTVNVIAFDGPIRGFGFSTVTGNVPAVAISDARTAAVS